MKTVDTIYGKHSKYETFRDADTWVTKQCRTGSGCGRKSSR